MDCKLAFFYCADVAIFTSFDSNVFLQSIIFQINQHLDKSGIERRHAGVGAKASAWWHVTCHVQMKSLQCIICYLSADQHWGCVWFPVQHDEQDDPFDLSVFATSCYHGKVFYIRIIVMLGIIVNSSQNLDILLITSSD